MLSPRTVARVRALLGQVSQREIARRCAIDRKTVARIAAGRRRERPPRDRLDDPQRSIWSSDGPEPCPGCGRLIMMPCLACLIEGHRALARRAHVA